MQRELDILDRRLPYDLDAEQAVLGSVIIAPDCLDEIAMRLTADDFFDEAHRTLYEHMHAMHSTGGKIDVMLLCDRLRKAGHFETIGGTAYLCKIGQAVPNAAHAVYYAEIVASHAKMRSLISAATETLRDAYDAQADAETVITEAEQRIFSVRERTSTKEPRLITTVMQHCMDEIDARLRGEQTDVVPTGFSDLDASMAGGLRPGQLVLVAARTGMGKSAFASDIARHVAGRDRRTVLFVALEMSETELGERMLSAESGLDSHRMRSGTLSQLDKQRLVEAAAGFREWPLYIEDDPSIKPSQIASVARRIARKTKAPISLVVVDYIQILDTEGDGKNSDSREREVARNARFFKRLSKELSCPVICVAQLNRKTEDGDHRPKLSHLRESGALEQDADCVLFVHRDDYYLHGEAAREAEGKAEIIIAKQRNGPRKDIDLRWEKRSMRFQNLAPERLREFDAYNEANGGDDGQF